MSGIAERMLPEGWRWQRLADICSAIRGVTFPSSSAEYVRFDGAIACLTTGAVQYSVDWETRRYIPQDLVSEVQLLKVGDLIVSTANSKELVGKSAQVKEIPFECTFGAFVTVLRPNKQTTGDFLYFLMNTSFAKEFCFVKSSNTTGISNLKVETLLDMEIPLPPLPEQKRIASILTERLAAVEQARKASLARLEAARALPAACLREVFESEEAKGWPTELLGDVSEVVSGITLGRKLKVGEETSSVPYLRVANVKDGLLDLEDITTVEATPNEIEKWQMQIGDLLLTEGGDPDKLGRGAVWEGQIPGCIHQNHIFRVRLRDDVIDPFFASLQMQSRYGKDYFLKHAKQTTGIATINQQVLKAFPLLVPDLSVQKAIASRVKKRFEQVECLATQVVDESEVVASLPASLLRQAFSGAL